MIDKLFIVAIEYFYLKSPKGATDINFTELFSNWEIPSDNTKVDKVIKELFEKYTELQKTELTGKTIDQVALKNELVNLIKKYIDTKVEGVATGSTNIINDTIANTTQTYSSSKLDNLLQDVLRQSDTSEASTASKLVKRNSQGIIYASNISLDAPTKVEYTDVKNSLVSDKWRFMVKDTDDGLLKAISIKDFVGSQNQTETLEAKVASIETASKKNVSSEDKEQTSSNTTGQTTKTKLPFTEGSKALLEVAADYKKNKSNFIDQNGQFSVDIFTKTFKGKSSLKDTESLGNWNVTVTPKSEIAVELQPASASSLNTKKIKYIVTVSNTELRNICCNNR